MTASSESKGPSWRTILLIWHKELRDQLRDRRTMFMVAVLPLLIYPLLGLSFLQVAQFLQEHPSRVAIVGAERIPAAQPLLLDDEITPQLLEDPKQRGLLQLQLFPGHPQTAADVASFSQRLRALEFDAVLIFPPSTADTGSRAETPALAVAQDASASASENSQGSSSPGEQTGLPAAQITREAAELGTATAAPQLLIHSAREKSRLAEARIQRVLRRRNEQILASTWQQLGLNEQQLPRLTLDARDVATLGQRESGFWATMLPFIVLVWALTGAFYPAVDVCAGEKERGTLETLLCSSAQRSEIVWGKLLTVMTFSVLTSLLNLFALGGTGSLMLNSIGQVRGGLPASGPTFASICYLLLALLPVSALFSALCVALASLARSSKEGQYYLMPLMLLSMPLMILPMSPTAELNLGSSLIPLTGLTLLLRELIAGNVGTAFPFVLPVLAVTLGCCWLAVRWAVGQFEKEEVLFRESEQFNPRLWLRQLWRDRGDHLRPEQAIFCGTLILALLFLFNFATSAAGGTFDLIRGLVIPQVVVIAGLAVGMALLLSRAPLKTLRLDRLHVSGLVLAALLALVIHPTVLAAQRLVGWIYPVNNLPGLEAVMEQMLRNDWRWVLFLFAVLPACCEELAFRGLILSGLMQHEAPGTSRRPRARFEWLAAPWSAIAISAALFAAVHPIVQQALLAGGVGMLLGWIAFRTRSLYPGIVFHATHNALTVGSGLWSQQSPAFQAWYEPLAEGSSWYARVALATSLGLSVWLLYALYRRTESPRLHQAAPDGLSGQPLQTRENAPAVTAE